jgi:hypothetical protein
MSVISIGIRGTIGRQEATAFECRALTFMAFLSLLMCTEQARAQFVCTVETPQYCAGSTNPIAKPEDAILFPISRIMTLTPDPNSSNTLWTQFENTGTTSNPYGPMKPVAPLTGVLLDTATTYVAASGRIIPPAASSLTSDGYPTDVVYAHRNANGLVQVDFANPAHAEFGGVVLHPALWDGTEVAPRLDPATYGPSTDFIALAVGDLDGREDANGELGDEVVVSFPVVDPEGTWKVEIFVLNYSDSTGAPVIAENNTIFSMCGPSCFVTAGTLTAARNQHKILSSGNVLSLAIGDFDGDGRNEIAEAHISDGDTIHITMFRYFNYTGNLADQGMSRLFDYSETGAQLDPTDPKSMVGSVSLASGDFDGDGTDELAMGYAGWWKNTQVTPGSADENNTCLQYNFTANSFLKFDCPYNGYAVGYNNAVTIYSSGLTSVNGTVVSAGVRTRIEVTNAATTVPNQVFITGGTGSWASLNGSWKVMDMAADGNSFTIDVDSRAFGALPTAPLTVSATRPWERGDSDVFDPHQGNNLANVFGLLPILDIQDANSRPTIQLTTGLFNFDATHTFHQRQILALWNTPFPQSWYSQTHVVPSSTPYWPYDLVAQFYTVSSDGTDKLTMESTQQLSDSFALSNNQYAHPHQRFSVTSTNIYGDQAPHDPTYSFVIGASTDQPAYRVLFGKVYDNTINVDHIESLASNVDNVESTYSSPFPVVAHDPSGSSFVLGSPVHIQVSEYLAPGFVLQEPPKHIAWLKDDTGTYSLVNVSKTVGTYTSVTLASSQTNATDSTTSSGWNITTSVALSASATVGTGSGALSSSTATVSDTLSASFEHAASQSRLNALSQKLEYVGSNSSRNDDYVEYNDTTMDVWRYRVYGAGNSASDPNKFYEIVVPGVPHTEHGGGTSIDWYRPNHENGNILSYPPGSEIPVDVALKPYQVNGENPPGLANGVMWNSEQYCFGSDSGSKAITITGTSATTDTVTTSNTFQEDNDLKVSAHLNLIATTQDYSAEWKLGSKQSWSNSQVSTNSTSNATAFSFVLGDGGFNDAYYIAPTLYTSLAGATKMSYGVDISTQASPVEGCDGTNWQLRYSQPDPALPLPKRFEYLTSAPSGTTLQFTPTIDREELKSFFVLSTEPDPIDGGYDDLGSTPTAGSTVQLAVTVFNYSVASPANAVAVRFSTIPMVANSDSEACANPNNVSGWVCPNSARTPLRDGETGQPVPDIQIASIPPWSSDSANPNWVVGRTNWKIPTSMAGARYRVYVNVIYTGTGSDAEANPPQAACTATPCQPLCSINSDQSNPCLKPTLNLDPLAPAQNNEGFSYITVAEPLTASFSKADAYTTDDSLVAVGRRGLWKRVVLGYQSAPIRLRVKANATTPEARHLRMVVRAAKEGDPKASLVAGKILQGVRSDGTSAFSTWRPEYPGIYHLTAELKELLDDAQVGNNTDTLLAIVLRRPGDLDGNSIIDWTDLAFLKKYVGKPLWLSACSYACDLNGDGRVNNADVAALTAACEVPKCALRPGQQPQPIAAATVWKLNRDELRALRGFNAAEWREFLRQRIDMRLSRFSPDHLKSVSR